MQIEGRTALVTGGASGLGAATVRELADLGARVLVADLQEEKGRALAAEVGPGVHFRVTDVTDEQAVEAAIGEARERLGGLHILVNCAGILLPEKLLGKSGVHNLARFRKVIDVNLVGTFNVLRLAADLMRHNEPNDEGERGVIVNTASIAAFEGQLGQVSYSASKAGIVGLTLPAARELARDGIRVCSIAPGTFDTEMIGGLSDAVKKSLAEQVPFPSRLGRPSEYARLVRFIIESPMLNGETIRLDGALRMSPR